MQTIHFTPYSRKYQSTVLQFVFDNQRTHTHLDWYRVGHWLQVYNPTMHLAWEGDKLVGFMAFSPVLRGQTWLRLAAIADEYPIMPTMRLLWESLTPTLRAQGATHIWILLVNPWLNPFVKTLEFDYMEDVVTMHRRSQELPVLRPHDVTLRLAYPEDYQIVMEIDHSAFIPAWQMHKPDVRQALRTSAMSTLAMYDGEIVGYQISTRHHNNGHLARIGVRPNIQGKGIGTILLHHLISQFERRFVQTMTVNTQFSNHQSQALYQRFGFMRNGFDLPTWRYTFPDSSIEETSS